MMSGGFTAEMQRNEPQGLRRLISMAGLSARPTLRPTAGGSGQEPRPEQIARRVKARHYLLTALALLALAPTARAEYAVLRNGQRLHVTGYERIGAVVRLQMAGGSVEVAADDVVAIEPEDYFPSLPPAASLKVPYAELIHAAAQKHGVEQELIASVIAIESNFNPRAVSPKLARGLMQLRPETAARLEVADVFDPAQNIDAGTLYLKELLARYKQDLGLALAAYNAGPDRVEHYRGIPPFPETRSYVQRVTRDFDARKHQKPAGRKLNAASAHAASQ
jgi:soluble lytic murein transglycosylase-like protein